jgi:hypothetical protein
MDVMAVDIDEEATPANNDSALGTREACRRIDENNTLDADEDIVDGLLIDTTALNVPSVHDSGTPSNPSDDTGGMKAFSYILNYSSANLTVEAEQTTTAGLNMLRRNAGSSIINVSDSVPDDNADDAWTGSALDGGAGQLESGSGVLQRVTLVTEASAVTGNHPLTMTFNVHLDVVANAYDPKRTENAFVAVNEPCDIDDDGMADAQDSDDDNDGVADVAELPCGSDPYDMVPPQSRPERVDGAFAGVDDDGDTQVDEALPVGALGSDCDGDGYTGTRENHVFSYLPGPPTDGDQKTCQAYDTSFPNPAAHVKPSTRWPSDIATSVFSLNKVNVQDLTSFRNPVYYFDQDVGSDPGDVRFDIVPGPGGPFPNDINIVDLTAVTSGVTGFPPMLGGARAFNGPECPYAP